ncbi:MAG: AAA family ATPase, partial [Desulfitobacteriaceae bacterium]|nr:AAA family ATPase [Desulfitobacteriaceae bacterium]
TSNVGASFMRKEAMGFASRRNEETEYKNMRSNIMEELKRTFRPEFLNRVDELVVFHALQKEDLLKITEIMLKEVTDRLKEQGLELQIAQSAVELIAKEGNDPTFGARPLRRAIQRLIEDELSEKILEGIFALGDVIRVTTENGKVMFDKDVKTV